MPQLKKRDKADGIFNKGSGMMGVRTATNRNIGDVEEKPNANTLSLPGKNVQGQRRNSSVTGYGGLLETSFNGGGSKQQDLTFHIKAGGSGMNSSMMAGETSIDVSKRKR